MNWNMLIFAVVIVLEVVASGLIFGHWWLKGEKSRRRKSSNGERGE
jgi:hypothetical protein